MIVYLKKIKIKLICLFINSIKYLNAYFLIYQYINIYIFKFLITCNIYNYLLLL